LCRGIIDFKKGNQPRTNIVTDEKGDLVTDCHRILARWRNHFSQLLTVHGVNDARQTEVHTAEPLVPEPSAFEVEMAIEKLKRCRSPGVDQIPTELITVGGRTIRSELHKLLILFGIRRNCLRSGRSRSLYLSIRRVIKQTVVSVEAYHLSAAYKIIYNILLSRLIPYAEEIIGDRQCGFWRSSPATGHIFAFVKYWKKKWEYKEEARQLFIDFKKAYDSARREVLFNTLSLVFP